MQGVTDIPGKGQVHNLSDPPPVPRFLCFLILLNSFWTNGLYDKVTGYCHGWSLTMKQIQMTYPDWKSNLSCLPKKHQIKQQH